MDWLPASTWPSAAGCCATPARCATSPTRSPKGCAGTSPSCPRLPGRHLCVQLDEPSLPAVLAGHVPTESGFSGTGRSRPRTPPPGLRVVRQRRRGAGDRALLRPGPAAASLLTRAAGRGPVVRPGHAGRGIGAGTRRRSATTVEGGTAELRDGRSSGYALCGTAESAPDDEPQQSSSATYGPPRSSRTAALLAACSDSARRRPASRWRLTRHVRVGASHSPDARPRALGVAAEVRAAGRRLAEGPAGRRHRRSPVRLRHAGPAEPPTAAQERHAELADELDDHQYRYYVLDAPTVSPTPIDRMLRELEALEEAVPAAAHALPRPRRRWRAATPTSFTPSSTPSG